MKSITKLMCLGLCIILLAGCGSESNSRSDSNISENIKDIKTNTSQELNTKERFIRDGLVGRDYFYTYDKSINDYVIMDFSSCAGEPGSGYIDNCNYQVKIEDAHFKCPVALEDGDCPVEPESKIYKIGFKDDIVYFYFPEKIKEYHFIKDIEEGVFLFKNYEEKCSFILNLYGIDLSYKTEDPCGFK